MSTAYKREPKWVKELRAKEETKTAKVARLWFKINVGDVPTGMQPNWTYARVAAFALYLISCIPGCGPKSKPRRK